MNTDFPAYLLEHARPENIIFADYVPSGLSILFPKGIMMLNTHDPLELAVKVALKTVLHYHPQFVAYTGGVFEGSVLFDHHLESDIEKMSLEVYRTRQDIVAHLQENIVLASKT